MSRKKFGWTHHNTFEALENVQYLGLNLILY